MRLYDDILNIVMMRLRALRTLCKTTKPSWYFLSEKLSLISDECATNLPVLIIMIGKIRERR